MFEKSTVINITHIPCMTSQYEYIVTLDVKGQTFTLHYTDVGNNAEYDEKIFIVSGNSFLDNDACPISSALWNWVDDNIDSIPDLEEGDILELDIEDEPVSPLKKMQKSPELMFKNNIAKIKAHPPSPKPQRRPKFN